MKILFAGGGTAGPAVPLLALAETIKDDHPNAELLFIGTKTGPEQQLVLAQGISFIAIPAGKLRRYITFRNLAVPFLVFAGFVRSFQIIARYKPDVVVTASGYVAVPVVFAAWMLRVKILIHQQDIDPSLTNKVLAPIADKITVTFETSVKDFYSGSGIFSMDQNTKIVWTGNPYRKAITHQYTETEKIAIRTKLGINAEIPILLIVGGGTGAQGINNLIEPILPILVKTFCVIHSTGKGKKISFTHPNYLPFEFLLNLPEILAIANIVVSRAGLSTITELSALGKVSIVIPMPASHQEKNGLYMQENDAAIVLSERDTNSELLLHKVNSLLYNVERQQTLAQNIKSLMPNDANSHIAQIIYELCQ